MKVNGDASIDKKFQEALIYNGVISEEEVIMLQTHTTEFL